MCKDIIQRYFSHYSQENQSLIAKAYSLAELSLQGHIRGNGKAFIEHPLQVAVIVANEIGLQAECVIAVFLHEAYRFQDSFDVDRSIFSDDVYAIVEGLNKIATIAPKDTSLEAENYKKLIIQYSTDPRVVVIKIADRLEVMRNLSIFSKLSKERKLIETQLLYLPLAHQLGLYNIKSELEDIYFKYSEPEYYRLITNKLKTGEKDRQALTSDFIEPLKQKLSEQGIKYKLKIRTKTAYSIYRKMIKQKVDFEGVYDVFAIRFIIDCDPDIAMEKDLCWKVYSYVTQEYEADTDRLRDWVTNPKSNGYESLHITIKNKENVYLEVQIRTVRMDEVAENGNASHWSYKGIKKEESISNWLSVVRNTLEHKTIQNYDDLPTPPNKEIFVFTPTGELRTLPQGASILDFAFSIHSGLGAKCIGAKLNSKNVSIKELLKTGDVVEIMTSKKAKPSKDWLNYVITSKARNKIKQVINEGEYKKATDGKELLMRRLKNWKLDFSDIMVSDFLKKYHFPTETSFYAAIGEENFDINIVKTFILEYGDKSLFNKDLDFKEQKKVSVVSSTTSSDDILIINSDNLKSLDYKMSRCCNPVYGDEVFGFVTRLEGIKIHRLSCPNASRLITAYPYRVQKVRWAESMGSSFQTSLKISTMMDYSVINKVIEKIVEFKASVRSYNVSENTRNSTYDINVKLSVNTNMELDKVISALRNMKNIIKVSRK